MKITKKEVFALVFLLCFTLFPGIGNVVLMMRANSTSIFAVILSAPLSLLITFMILKIRDKLNGKNIFEYNIDRFKFFGHIINFIIALEFLVICMILSWHFINFIVSQFLNNTSYSLIIIFLFSVIFYAAYKGIKTISRTSLILFYIFSFILIIIFTTLFNKVEVSNIFPLFNISINSFVEACFYTLTLSTTPLFLILIIPNNVLEDEKNFNKYVYMAVILAFSIVAIFLFYCLAILGTNLGTLYAAPEYAIFKKIKILDFIQRIENFVSTNTFIVLFISISLYFYAIKKHIETYTKKIKNAKIITTCILLLLCFLTPFIAKYIIVNYKLNIVFYKFYYFVIPLYLWLIISFICSLKKQKQSS